ERSPQPQPCPPLPLSRCPPSWSASTASTRPCSPPPPSTTSWVGPPLAPADPPPASPPFSSCPIGRARAWLRLSLNAQCLETSLRALMTQHKHLLQVFYDPSLSLLLCPEGSLILLALVSTLETFSFSLHLKPGLDREVAYPFIDWAGGGQGGRGAGTGGSLKRGKDKKAALALREKEQDGREGGREGGGPAVSLSHACLPADYDPVAGWNQAGGRGGDEADATSPSTQPDAVLQRA
ncbi:rap2 interacting protein x isoform 3, partial [Nannochloropsis gaditana]